VTSDIDDDLITAVTLRMKSGPDFVGHYTSNYLLDHGGRKVVVRKPREIDNYLDARMIRESDALRLAASTSQHVPDLVYADNNILVEGFCEGSRLDLTQSGWQNTYRFVVKEMTKIYHLDVSEVKGPHTVAEWWSWMRLFTDELWRRLIPDFYDRYHELGLGPLETVWESRRRLGGLDQPTRLVHSDLHEENILVGESGPWVLDWELALKADPLWDAAVCLHRTKWRHPEQRALVRALWLGALNMHGNADADAILESYIFLERWKSVLVDVVRYPREIRQAALLPDVIEERARSLSHKLTALSVHMPCRTLTPTKIADLLTSWAGRG